MRRRLFFILAILILLGAIFGLLKTIYKTYLAGQRVKFAEEEIWDLSKRQEGLKEEFSQKDNLEFVEQEARDRLAMVKEGETIVVMGKKIEIEIDSNQNDLFHQKLSNPEKWWRLFF